MRRNAERVDPASFRAEIVPAYEPIVLRGLVPTGPQWQAAARSDAEAARPISQASTAARRGRGLCRPARDSGAASSTRPTSRASISSGDAGRFGDILRDILL